MRKQSVFIQWIDRDAARPEMELEPLWITILGCLFLAILLGAGLMAI